MTLHMWRVILLYKEYHKTILQEKKGLIDPFKKQEKKERNKKKRKEVPLKEWPWKTSFPPI